MKTVVLITGTVGNTEADFIKVNEETVALLNDENGNEIEEVGVVRQENE